MRIRALREGQTHREVGTQSLGASYWEAAGLSNSEGGTTMFRLYREEWGGCGPLLATSSIPA